MGKLDKLSDDVQFGIMEEYKSGKSLKAIADAQSCTAPTVAAFLRRKGVTVRGKGKFVVEVKATATNDDIIEGFNVSGETATIDNCGY